MKKVLNRGGIKRTLTLTFKQRILYYIALLSGIGLLGTIIGCISLIFVFTAFSSTLPSPRELTNREIAQSTKVYDRNGQLLYSVFGDKDRTLVEFHNVSPHLLNATLAIEDADFYEHSGIDTLGLLRGILITATGQGKQGGSTLTQQVAKNALLTTDRTLTRKIKDIVLALQIENSYTKDEILQMYLNEVPYGGTIWGAEAASKSYFGKKAADLSLAEAALIAGLPQRPTYYSPFVDPDAAKNRQLRVLKMMYESGWIDKNGNRQHITEEEYNWAKDEPLVYASNKSIINAPHFVMYILNDVLPSRYSEDAIQKGGLNITTTLDLNLQKELEKIAAEEVKKAENLDLTNAAVVAIDPNTRDIVGMVGSVDYYSKEIDGQFNAATGYRQPGSTLKPITYLTGLTQGYTASSVIYDVYTEFKTDENSESYKPRNYGGWGFHGPIQIRYALANSVNVTAVKMLDLVGTETMVKLANDLGLNFKYNPQKHGLAITLGGGEVRLLDLVNTYSSLADGGKYKDINPILEIKDGAGNLLEKKVVSDGKQVVDSGLAWIISDIMSDNNARSMAFGTGSQLNIKGNKVAVKTGTSNDLKDNWTVGFTRDIAIGVWVGNNKGQPMNSRLASGLTGAAPIWNRSMTYYLKDHPHSEFSKPENVMDLWIGSTSGMLQTEDEEDRRVEYFLKGTEPTAKSDMFRRVKICDDGKLEDRTYTVYEAEKPDWQSFVNAWVRETYKDDESQLYRHLDPKYDKEERGGDKFDTDNCEE
jgi:penicillin-binding protein 1C